MKLDFEYENIGPLMPPPKVASGQDVYGIDAHDPDPRALLDNGFFGFFPHDARSRPFHQLRSQLRKLLEQKGHSVLAVTSVKPGDGKTFVAANLAAAMSAVHPTLLVDLDLRRSMLTQRLGMPVRAGIDDYLSGASGWYATGTRVSGHRLTVHGVRESRQDACSLIASRRFDEMASLVRSLAGSPICIMDTPPVLVCDEVLSIGKVADAVLLVVDEGRTSRADLMDAARLLSPTPIIGSVLNRSLTADRTQQAYEEYYRPHR